MKFIFVLDTNLWSEEDSLYSINTFVQGNGKRNIQITRQLHDNIRDSKEYEENKAPALKNVYLFIYSWCVFVLLHVRV